MAGVVEEGVKVAGGVVDAMRGSPLAIANIVLNICFLVFLFYYVSRISTRAENVVKDMFAAQDRLYEQWSVIIKDTNDLTEKTMHCLLPEDALKLLQLPYRPASPERPAAPAPAEPLRPKSESLLFKLPALPPLPPLPIHN